MLCGSRLIYVSIMWGIGEGTIYSDEVKTCTIENYVWVVEFNPPEPEDKYAADNTQS